MPDKKFELGDYVEVKDRIKLFYELFGQGRLVTDTVTLTREPDDVPRVMVRALAYRTPDDPHPGVGHSWIPVPGKTPYTRDSEVENAETSAWGRAIGSLGILIDRSIASANEIENKRTEGEQPRSGFVGTKEHPAFVPNADGGLVGTAIAQGTQDFELRQSPDGWRLPFRVKDGNKSFIVVAENDIAQALATIKETVIGERVTVWGHWSDETIPKRGDKPAITYRVLHLERIATPDGILPAPAFDSHRDPLPGRGGPLEPVEPEALPDPIFDESEMAAIDAALDKVPAA